MLVREWSCGIRKGVFKGSQQQRQWGPKLVADITEEGRFRAIQFRQRLSSAPLLLVHPRVADRRSNLARYQSDERPILRVDREPRTQARNEHSVGTVLTSLSNWQQECFAGCLGPGAARQSAEVGRQLLQHYRCPTRDDLTDGPRRLPRVSYQINYRWSPTRTRLEAGAGRERGGRPVLVE